MNHTVLVYFKIELKFDILVEWIILDFFQECLFRHI